jgi:hypothetical protein
VEINGISLYNMYLLLKTFSLLFRKLQLAERKTIVFNENGVLQELLEMPLSPLFKKKRFRETFP